MESTCKSVSRILPLVAKDVWTSINSFADIGGGSGYMSIELCRVYPHLRAVSGDLKALEPVFNSYIAKEEAALASRVSFREVDFKTDDFPKDVEAILFGNMIHSWDDTIKRLLFRKAFEALPSGGYLVFYEYFLDGGVCENYLMSLLMQMNPGGRQFTFKEVQDWLAEAGFTGTEIRKIDTYHDVVIARKP